MKKNPRWFVIFLAVSLILAAFTGCDSSQVSSEPDQEDSQIPSKVQGIMAKVTDLAVGTGTP